MDLFEILLTALGVSVDAFSVSVGGSLACPRRKRLKNACLAAVFFGGFQFFMPLAGFFCAGFLTEAVSSAGNVLAFVLLLLVGGKMIYEGVKARKERTPAAGIEGAFSSWKMLLVSSVATSIDAFAVGGGLAFAGKTFFLPCFAMGIVTGFASFTGVQLGARLGRLTRRPGRTLPEWLLLPAGGAAIIFVGIKLLFS